MNAQVRTQSAFEDFNILRGVRKFRRSGFAGSARIWNHHHTYQGNWYASAESKTSSWAICSIFTTPCNKGPKSWIAFWHCMGIPESAYFQAKSWVMFCRSGAYGFSLLLQPAESQSFIMRAVDWCWGGTAESSEHFGRFESALLRWDEPRRTWQLEQVCKSPNPGGHAMRGAPSWAQGVRVGCTRI